MSGCNGCRQEDPDKLSKKEDEKRKKRRKPDFESNTPVLLPGIFPKPKKSLEEREEEEKKNPNQFLNDPVMRTNRAKIGHWYSANVPLIANNFNFEGQLSAFSMDGIAQPVAVPKTDYYLSTTRPTSLPKGEWKNFETNVYVPRRDKNVAQATINYSLDRSGGGLSQLMFAQPTLAMRAFQHHILLLSSRPDSYGFLKLTDNIQLTGQTGMGEIIPPFYYIVPTTPGDPLPIPRHALAMTTVAYMIWDDYDPALLEQEYQDAILDWLHFGGQLIVSGPDCLDKLQNSFLADYLPAHFDGSKNLTNSDIEELNRNWSLPGRHDENTRRALKLSEKVPLLGVTFKPLEGARFVDGTGEIAIERKVGRGRIVATSFSINSPTLRGWRSLKSFINGVLLRKPPRHFGTLNNEDVAFEWKGDGTSCFDPMLNTSLRFVSRDLGTNGTQRTADDIRLSFSDVDRRWAMNGYEPGDELQMKTNQSVNPASLRGIRNLKDTWRYGGFQDVGQSGLGGWNDDSGISRAARETLKEAAGITPPSSDFVLKMLGAYLLILVPVNWLLFRLIGKVEYAWVAAPIIAIVGAFMVIRMASLDIGFVRSNTQVGLLEVHADYDRGHLTEYSALYTSLSTKYDMELESPAAQALPFGVVNSSQEFNRKESISRVNLKRTTENRLEGFQIQSNSTGLLHSENILNLGGVISYIEESDNRPYLANTTGIDLRHVGIIRRNEDGENELAWVGDLPSGGDKELEFAKVNSDEMQESWRQQPEFSNTRRDASELWDRYFGEKAVSMPIEEIRLMTELEENWDRYGLLFQQVITNQESTTIAKSSFEQVYQRINNRSQVSLGRFFDSVIRSLELGIGETRLIGCTSQRIGSTRFNPASTQINQLTLVLVHLKHPDLPIALRDLNAAEDFRIVSDIDQQKANEKLDEELQN